MGKRGPTRVPNAILEARGSWLAKTRKNIPISVKGDITPPIWLCEDARAAWNELAPRLSNLNVLTELDGRVLARYCSYWVLWKDCLVEEERNESNLEKYATQLLRLEKELGLTPSARSSIKVPQKKEKDRFLRVV